MALVCSLVLLASVIADDIAFAPPATSAFAGVDPLIVAEAAYSPPAPESFSPEPSNSPQSNVQSNVAPDSNTQYAPPPSDFLPQIVSSVASTGPETFSENVVPPQSVSSTPVFSVAYSPPSSGDYSVAVTSQQSSQPDTASVDQSPQPAPVPATEYGLPGGGYQRRSSYKLNDGTVYTDQSSSNGNFQYSYYTPDGSSRTEILSTKQLEKDKPPVVVYRGSYSYPTSDGKLVAIQYLADENGFLARPAHLP